MKSSPLLWAAGAVALAGCSTTPQALHNVDAIVTAGTNTLHMVAPVVAEAGGPVGSVVALGMAAVSAGLVAWQSWLHNKATLGVAQAAAGAVQPVVASGK